MTAHYGLDGELLGETVYSSGGAKIGERDYLWLDTLPLAQSERVFSGGSVTSSSFVYLHSDQLNTPRLATNGAGTVVWRWDSDAFGIGAANEDPDSDTNLVNVRLRFPGQYLDAETGLHYNYFRDYDAVTGRYIQSDPIGLEGGIDTYLYADGNPLSRADRFGLQSSIPIPAPGPIVVPPVAIPGTPANDQFVDAVNGLLGGAPSTVDIVCFLNPLLCPRMMSEGGNENGDTCPTPETHPDDFVKLKGGQGYRDRDGNLWNKDKLHKDHWDVSDRRGNKVREIDFGGRQIWPGGPKNRNKEP